MSMTNYLRNFFNANLDAQLIRIELISLAEESVNLPTLRRHLKIATANSTFKDWQLLASLIDHRYSINEAINYLATSHDQVADHLELRYNQLNNRNCKYLCNSSYLRCAVNPTAPNCLGCNQFQRL